MNFRLLMAALVLILGWVLLVSDKCLIESETCTFYFLLAELVRAELLSE